MEWYDAPCSEYRRPLCSVRLWGTVSSEVVTTTGFPFVYPPRGFAGDATATCRCPLSKELVLDPSTPSLASCREIDDCAGDPCGNATYGKPHACTDLANDHRCRCAPGHDIVYIDSGVILGSGRNQTCHPVDWCEKGGTCLQGGNTCTNWDYGYH